MADTISGGATTAIEYRRYRETNYGIIEEIGVINHVLDYPEGTGQYQINGLFYDTGVLSGTRTYDLSALQFERLNHTFNVSFLGVGSTNVKGVFIRNYGENPISVSLPFSNSLGSFQVAGSGEYKLTNGLGWILPSGSYDIALSGDSEYDIALLGSKLPIFLNITGNTVNLEYKTDVSASSTLNFEYILLNQRFDKAINIENLVRVSFDNTVNIDTWSEFAVTASFPIEYTMGQDAYSLNINIENKSDDTNINLLKNIEFLPDLTIPVDGTYLKLDEDQWFFILEDENEIPEWTFSAESASVEYSPGLWRTENDLNGDSLWNGPNDFELEISSARTGRATTCSQTVTGLDITKNYRLLYRYFAYAGVYWPIVLTIKSSTGATIYTKSYNTLLEELGNENIVFMPTTSQITIEWSVPRGDLTYMSSKIPHRQSLDTNPMMIIYNQPQTTLWLRLA